MSDPTPEAVSEALAVRRYETDVWTDGEPPERFVMVPKEEFVLMEAVCEGVRLATTPNTGNAVAIITPDALHATQALATYRKERGL